jgi:hypothetical protein
MIYYLIRDAENHQIIKLEPPWVELILDKYISDNSLLVCDTVIDYFLDNYKQFDLSKYSCVVFNLSVNPVTVEYFLPKIHSTTISIKYHILTGLFNQFQHETTANFFPFWAVWSSLQATGLSPKDRSNKISCLNGTPWIHRKLTYIALSKKSYFNDIVFTFGNRPYHNSFGDIVLSDSEITAFNQLADNVCFLESDAITGIDISTSHPAYLDSYVNLVTETTVRASTPMLSEKAFKPILAGQLFVLIASPGAIQFLRDIGIDTFDDIIDHSYDIIQDIRVRIDQALVQIDRLVQMDLKSLFVQIQPRLEQNNNYLRSQEFRNQFKLDFG